MSGEGGRKVGIGEKGMGMGMGKEGGRGTNFVLGVAILGHGVFPGHAYFDVSAVVELR